LAVPGSGLRNGMKEASQSRPRVDRTCWPPTTSEFLHPTGWLSHSMSAAALPCSADRSVPGRGGPEPRRHRRPDRAGARRYTGSRQVGDCNGYQRSLPVTSKLQGQLTSAAASRQCLGAAGRSSRFPIRLAALSKAPQLSRQPPGGRFVTLVSSWELTAPGASPRLLAEDGMCLTSSRHELMAVSSWPWRREFIHAPVVLCVKGLDTGVGLRFDAVVLHDSYVPVGQR
jgi:hypothetical protein